MPMRAAYTATFVLSGGAHCAGGACAMTGGWMWTDDGGAAWWLATMRRQIDLAQRGSRKERCLTRVFFLFALSSLCARCIARSCCQREEGFERARARILMQGSGYGDFAAA